MRVLIGPDRPDHRPDQSPDHRTGEELSDDDLAELYAVPQTPWLRINMISTVDGSATGSSGTSGTINNAVDKRVFDTLRGLADAIVVGAGTARAELYGPTDRPIVLVSRHGDVPEQLRDAAPGTILMATYEAAEHLDEARAVLGDEHVLVLGGHRVDLGRLKATLAERGHRSLLCEGGPHLLRDLLDEGAADELTATIVPKLVAGTHPRITDGPPVDVPLELRLLLEHEGTLLGRWFT